MLATKSKAPEQRFFPGRPANYPVRAAQATFALDSGLAWRPKPNGFILKIVQLAALTLFTGHIAVGPTGGNVEVVGVEDGHDCWLLSL